VEPKGTRVTVELDKEAIQARDAVAAKFKRFGAASHFYTNAAIIKLALVKLAESFDL
jgi:hypothetical protein